MTSGIPPRDDFAPALSGGPQAQRRWFAAAAALAAALLAVLLWLQPISIDEPWIADYFRVFSGRLFAPGEASWALSTTSDGTPKVTPLLWGYVYQALTFGVFGISMAVARVQFFLSAALAGLALHVLLTSRGVPASTARWFALAFAGDNLLGEAVRGGRLDPVAIALGCLALAAWARATASRKSAWAVAAGCAGAAALFVWPTALILGGILLFDWIAAFRADRRAFFRNAVAMALGAGAFALLSLAILFFWMGPESFALNFRLLGLEDPAVQWGTGWFELKALGFFLGRNPAALLFAAAALVLTWRSPAASLRSLAPFLLCLGVALLLPPLYIWRLVYLLPAVYLGLHAVLLPLPRLRRPALALLVLATLGYGLAARAGFAVLTREARDYGAFAGRLAAAIPPGSTVYSNYYWPVYYAGLDHGWRMFLYMQDFESRVPVPARVASFDYVVTPGRQPLPGFVPAGEFAAVAVIDPPPPVLGRQVGYGATVFRRVKPPA